MLLTLILTPSFSSPILEEDTVGVRNDTFTCTLLDCSSRSAFRKGSVIFYREGGGLWIFSKFCEFLVIPPTI